MKTSEIDENYCSAFAQFNQDEETTVFLENSVAKSDWVFTQLYHMLAKAFLRMFMTNTSING